MSWLRRATSQPDPGRAARDPRNGKERSGRERSRTDQPLFFWFCFVLSLSIAVFPFAGALAQEDSTADSPTAGEIVQQLVAHNEQRAQELGSYTSRRHYHIAYQGIPHAAAADIMVDVTCDGPASKKFEIVSESGSHLLLDHVLKRLLKSEQDASHDSSENALTPENYSFRLVKTEADDGRPTYVLAVEPKERRALLYRGTIWVDARDYAVVRIEAQPARNPSFWIRDTQIHHVYEKKGEFWFPEHNRSESKIRLGGTAILTIDYGEYRITNTTARQAESSTAAALTPLH